LQKSRRALETKSGSNLDDLAIFVDLSKSPLFSDRGAFAINAAYK
jgi:hypothetical protein